jgi:predicted DNA-binding transcriptional regulator YafY
MRIQRLQGILSILATVDKITVQELADRFEVSRRTIFRDLDMLNLYQSMELIFFLKVNM